MAHGALQSIFNFLQRLCLSLQRTFLMEHEKDTSGEEQMSNCYQKLPQQVLPVGSHPPPSKRCERRKYGMLGTIEVEGENTMSIRDWEVIIRFLGETSPNPL